MPTHPSKLRLSIPSSKDYHAPPIQMAILPDGSRAPLHPADPWNHKEGYYQSGLFPGTGETVKARYNPPEIPDPWNHKEGYYQSGLFPGTGETVKARYNPPEIPDPWNHKEGYYQSGLFPGTGETVKARYNPPQSTPIPVSRSWTGRVNPPRQFEPDTSWIYDQNYIAPNDHPFIPGIEPAGYQAEADKYSWWQHLKAGADQGWKYAVESKPWGFTRSSIWHRAPKAEWDGLNRVARAGYLGGRVAGDFLGEGSRSLVWRIHPMDMAGTTAMKSIEDAGGNRTAQVLGMAAATNTLGLASGNMNYFNLDEAGRPTGFSATDPNPEDPRQTNNTALEYFNRAVLGRTGRLLPWEQFHAERPEVDYDTYEAYQEYLRDPGILGLAKGTLDGVDGPEARIMGYRVTPLGALAAAGVIGGATLGVKRIAGMKK